MAQASEVQTGGGSRAAERAVALGHRPIAVFDPVLGLGGGGAAVRRWLDGGVVTAPRWLRISLAPAEFSMDATSCVVRAT